MKREEINKEAKKTIRTWASIEMVTSAIAVASTTIGAISLLPKLWHFMLSYWPRIQNYFSHTGLDLTTNGGLISKLLYAIGIAAVWKLTAQYFVKASKTK